MARKSRKNMPVANRTPLIAQIRETQVGFPTTTILAEGRIQPSAISQTKIKTW